MRALRDSSLGTWTTAAASALALLAALPAAAQQRPAGTLPEDLKPGELVWDADAAPAGPLVVLVSLSERFAYVYRNAVEIGSAALHIDDPELPLAEGVFAILDRHTDHDNPWIPGRPAPRWMAVWTDAPEGLDQSTDRLDPSSNLNRVHIPAAFAARVYEVLTPGSSVVITNRTAAPDVSADTDFVVMASHHSEEG